MADEISREVLLIYLSNLRTMEIIIFKSDEQLIKLRKRIESAKSFKDTLLSTVIAKPQPPICPKPLTVSSFFKGNGCIFELAILIILFAVICFLNELVFIGYLAIIVVVAFFIFCIWLTVSSSKDEKNKYDAENMKYQKEYDEYLIRIEKKKKRIAAAQKRYNDLVSKILNEIDNVTLEKSKFSDELKKAYDLNIIPIQFRDIYGISYLYDYLSTSNQSLSDALMQYNLEAIKQKLDEVINLQSEAIVQQAQANAALYEQNQRILEAAQATMNNTAIAAKYAQISAVNSELALKMQEKQLAYQRAVF